MTVKKQDWIALAVIAAAVAVVFGRACFFTELLSDDTIYVERRHLLLFTRENLLLWSRPVLGLWGPLAGYSFMLDHLVWGPEHFIFGARFVNVLLHFAGAAAFFFGLRWLRFSTLWAALPALFWAVHPQRAESVAWLSERKDVLVVSLGLWSIALFIRFMRHGNRGAFVLSLLLFAVTFFVKPALIGLPVVIAACLWGRYRTSKLVPYLKYSGPYWAVSLVWFAGYKLVFDPVMTPGSEGIGRTLAVMGWRYGMYFLKTFFPVGLNPFYPHFSFENDSLWPMYLVGALTVALLVLVRRGNTMATYVHLPLLMCFSAAVFPALFMIGDVDFADRYSYFPSVFVLTGSAAALCGLIRRRPAAGKAVAAAAAASVLLMGALCRCQVSVWETQDSYMAAALSVPKPNYRSVITDTVRKFDKGDMPGVRKGVALLHEKYGDLSENRRKIIIFFTTSLDGVLLVRSGRPAEGMKKLERVIWDPAWELLVCTPCGYPRCVLLTAAGVYQKAGMRKAAAEVYRRLAKLYGLFEPMEREFYLALSALCLGNKEEALSRFEKAQALSPNDENIRRNIAALKAAAGTPPAHPAVEKK
ncbi:MAG: tetratricopeptide repeat protein [Lentisphaeria bacterium]|nr:tetratricopeptide repeat protein [Lentisphaeria bacterium]